LCNWDVAKW